MSLQVWSAVSVKYVKLKCKKYGYMKVFTIKFVLYFQLSINTINYQYVYFTFRFYSIKWHEINCTHPLISYEMLEIVISH